MITLHEELTTRRGGSLVCTACGYGIARETPPGPCPMCQAADAWARPYPWWTMPADGADDGAPTPAWL